MHDIIPSLQVALENELQERDFYLMHSRRTKNHLGRAMFEYIAKDEEEHYQRLQKAHEHLTHTGAWPENISLTVQKTSIMDVLLSIARRADITASPDLDDRKALQVAIDFETKAYEFYARLGKTTSAILHLWSSSICKHSKKPYSTLKIQLHGLRIMKSPDLTADVCFSLT